MRSHRRASRRLGQDIAELSRAVTDPRTARDLARQVLRDLETQPRPSNRDVVAAVADRCSDDGQRSGLAAYLHLCRDFSFEALGEVFGTTAAAARRLVERGTGAVPVTSADACRGWALVAPRPGRTTSELRAASGHLSLCRHCRYRLRAHAVLEHRVAAVGTAAFGASVTAAVGRAFAGGHIGSAAAGAITGPIVALTTAAALTAGVGAVAVTTHHDSTSSTVVRDGRHDQGDPADVGSSPSPASNHAAPRVAPRSSEPPVAPTPGGVAPNRLAPLPGQTLLRLPQVSPPPLPLPTVSLSPLPITTSPLPVPLPSLSLPPLP